MTPGKAGGLLGERLKGAHKTVSRPRRLHLCLPLCKCESSGRAGGLPHWVKAKVRLHRYADGTLAVFHGPRKLADYAADGPLSRSDIRPWRKSAAQSLPGKALGAMPSHLSQR
jgi:hypothetical protein